MIEISAGQTKRPFGFEPKETSLAELLATFRAEGVTNDPKHHDLVAALFTAGAV
jgi:hypothetical protein